MKLEATEVEVQTNAEAPMNLEATATEVEANNAVELVRLETHD